VDRRILLLVLPLVAACTVQAPSVSFSTICAPPVASDCSFSSTCDAQYIGTILLDASRANRLFLAVEATNQAPKNDDSTSGRVNTTNAFLQEIRVSYGGPVALATNSYRISQLVPSNGTAVVAFPVMDLAAGTLPAGVVEAVAIAKVTGKGVFGDGTSFETPELEIPVVLCDDCIGNACPGAATPLAACPPTALTPRIAQMPATYACP